VKRNTKIVKPWGDGKFTDAQFWGMIRSLLRRKSVQWEPIRKAKIKARRPYIGTNKRAKWQYQCSECEHWFMDKEVEVDHIHPCGKLSLETAGQFIAALFCDSKYLRVVCKECHNKKTHGKED
jgi:5-methylcytosine-specific restriction endonuclease McrA